MPRIHGALHLMALAMVSACGAGGGGGDDGTATGARLSAAHNPDVASLTEITEPTGFLTLNAVASVHGNSGPVKYAVSDTELQASLVTIGEGGEYGAGYLIGETERLGTDALTPYETYVAAGTTTVLQPGDAESGLHYTSFGIWNDHHIDFYYGIYPSYADGQAFVWGVMTPGSSVPSAGSATYDGYAGIWWGRATGMDAPYDVSSGTDFGDARLAVNFGSRQVSGRLSNFEDFTSLVISLNGSYTASGISGTVTTSGDATLSGLSGNFVARFYGPSAEELGGVLLATGTDAAITGAFVASR